MKEWKLKKVIQILTACLAMIVVLNVSGISMKTMQTIDINKKESKTNRRDSDLQMESETRETISRILNEQIQTELPQIAITFDDGPSVCTPALLDGLKERGVKATFFLVGENVETYPDIVKRIYEEGHLIGNHTYQSALWGLAERTGELSGCITCHVDGRPFGLDYGKYR